MKAAYKVFLVGFLCGLVPVALTDTDGSDSDDDVIHISQNTTQEVEDDLTNLFTGSRDKFLTAIYNISEYLPLSIDYADTVGQECDIIEYNKSYYTTVGLIIAAVLIVLGVVFGFFGYRLIKTVLFLIGFLIGATITYLIILALTIDINEAWVFYVAASVALVVGTFCGLLTICIYYVGIFLAGGSTGFLITWFILAAIDVGFFRTHIWFPIVASLVMAIVVGIIALWIQKWFFMLGTSILGAFMVTWGLDYYIELGAMIYYLLLFAEHRSDLKPCWYSWSILPLLVILAVAGMIVQALVTGRKYNHKKELKGVCCGLGKKKRRTRNTSRGRYMEMKEGVAEDD